MPRGAALLRATCFFINAAGMTKGEYHLNQFGFTLGGPVSMPKVHNGKDQTFFFVDYQGLYNRESSACVNKGALFL
jgi:hypothetical protein